MLLRLSHWFGTWINEMPNGGITTDQNKLLKCGAITAGFKQPEHAFYSHIHDLLGCLFYCCQMKDVCHTIHCFLYNFAMFNGAMNILYSFVRLQLTVMAQRPNHE